MRVGERSPAGMQMSIWGSLECNELPGGHPYRHPPLMPTSITPCSETGEGQNGLGSQCLSNQHHGTPGLLTSVSTTHVGVTVPRRAPHVQHGMRDPEAQWRCLRPPRQRQGWWEKAHQARHSSQGRRTEYAWPISPAVLTSPETTNQDILEVYWKRI